MEGRSLETISSFNTENYLDAIELEGYCVVPNAVEPFLIDAIRERLDTYESSGLLEVSKNDFEGFHTARLFNLLKHDKIFEQIPIHENLLAIGEGVFDEGLLLSSISALVIRPGETAQPIHADTQLLNLARPHVPISLTCMLAISDYTADNGATRLVPRSHLRPEAPKYGSEAEDAVSIEFASGSALLFDSQVWHGGSANHSAESRVGLAMAYCAGWTRPQENLLLGLPEQQVMGMPRRLQELLGYSIYKGQWGHIARRDPIELLGQNAGRGMVWDASQRVAARGKGPKN
jgi:ectoine hydroxylase-related dioxygenase (phytanoyl-CoA dioxygenase family)